MVWSNHKVVAIIQTVIDNFCEDVITTSIARIIRFLAPGARPGELGHTTQ